MSPVIESQPTSVPQRIGSATIAECEDAWHEARCNRQPAKLREIVALERRRRSGMMLLDSKAGTRVSQWLMKRFAEAARWGLRSNFQVLVDAEAHGIALWAGAPLLHLFVRHSFDEGVDLLLASGAGVDAFDKDDWTPLHHLLDSTKDQAAKLGTLKRLLAAGASLTPFPGGMPVLTSAVYRNLTAVAAALIAKGADVNGTDPQNITALDWILRGEAQFRNLHREVWERVYFLLSAGADLSRSHNGMTPLHHAVANASPEVVAELLWRGAPVDARGPGNRTPLHFLHNNGWGKEAVLKVLVHHGANLKALNDDDLTAAGAAAASGHLELARLLQRYGG